MIAVSKQDSQPTPPPVHLYITHSIRTARYHTLQKPHNVQSIRSDNSSHQCYATESIFLLHHRQEDAGILQYSHFQRKIKQQEKGKRKHMAPKNLKPQLILKKKKQLTLTGLPGEISYSSVLGKHDRIDERVESYGIVLLHFKVCITYFEI